MLSLLAFIFSEQNVGVPLFSSINVKIYHLKDKKNQQRCFPFYRIFLRRHVWFPYRVFSSPDAEINGKHVLLVNDIWRARSQRRIRRVHDRTQPDVPARAGFE